MAFEIPEPDDTPPVNRNRTGTGLTGRVIGGYRLVRELGHGGQGYVWEAEDLKLHRRVALKLLPHAASFSGQARLRFEREAEIASKLEHPGLCTVYEVGEDAGIPFIAMQLVEGEAVDSVIKRARAGAMHATFASCFFDLSEAQQESAVTGSKEPSSSSTTPTLREDIFAICRLIESAARALHAAHEAGLVHRDIKPGNLMATPDGGAIILDFGLGRDESSDGATLTHTGDFMGTPAYMSPEQIENPARLDRRTDIYSLGVTLFECLTLVRPFSRASRQALLDAIRAAEVEPPRDLNPAIPKDLSVVVLTAMERAADRRYQSALEFADELRRIVSYEPIVARPAGPMLRLRRWTQRSPALATAMVAAILLLIAAIVAASLFFLQNKETGRALMKESTALAKERAALTQKDAALVDYLRMSDVKRLRDAKAVAAELFPPHPDLVPKLEAWQEKYRITFENQVSHEAALLRLCDAALSYADDDRIRDHAEAFAEITRLEAEQAEAEAKLEERESEKLEDRLLEIEDRLDELRNAVEVRKSWSFADDGLAFKHETLTQLVADLKAATGPKGVWQDMAKRLEVSKTIKAKTVDAFAKEWSETIEGIAASPKYSGLRIIRQVGLIPLGPDPSSGLFEFLHWLSHESGAPLPVRSAKGRFEVKKETGIILVLLPGGTFMMGAQSKDASQPNFDKDALRVDGPVHDVVLDAFFMGKYEVTQAQWERATESRPSRHGPGTRFGDHDTTLAHPVEQVSWTECNAMTSRWGLLLPTEAQWEYACRAGTSTVWSCGAKSELSRHANLADAFCKENGGPLSWEYDTDLNDGRVLHAPVGSYEPNGFGLFDAHGSVREWCRDEFYPYNMSKLNAGDGLRLGQGSRDRIYRGGSFLGTAVIARSASRRDYAPELRSNDLGYRASRAITK